VCSLHNLLCTLCFKKFKSKFLLFSHILNSHENDLINLNSKALLIIEEYNLNQLHFINESNKNKKRKFNDIERTINNNENNSEIDIDYNFDNLFENYSLSEILNNEIQSNLFTTIYDQNQIDDQPIFEHQEEIFEEERNFSFQNEFIDIPFVLNETSFINFNLNEFLIKCENNTDEINYKFEELDKIPYNIIKYWKNYEHILKYCSIKAAQDYLDNLNELKREEFSDFPKTFHYIQSNLKKLNVIEANTIEKTNIIYYNIADYIKYLFIDEDFLLNLNILPKNKNFQENYSDSENYKKILNEAYNEGYIPLIFYYYFDNFVKYMYSLNKKECGGLYFIFSNVNIKYYYDVRNILLFGLTETSYDLDILYKELYKQLIELNTKNLIVYHKLHKKNYNIRIIFKFKGADLEQMNLDNNLFANNSNRPYYNLNLKKQQGHRYEIYLNNEYINYKRSFIYYYEQYKIFLELNEDEKKIFKNNMIENHGFKIDIYNNSYLLAENGIDIIDLELNPISHILFQKGTCYILFNLIKIKELNEEKINNINKELLNYKLKLNINYIESFDMDDWDYFYKIINNFIGNYISGELKELLELYSELLFYYFIPKQTYLIKYERKMLYRNFKIKFLSIFYKQEFYKYFIGKTKFLLEGGLLNDAEITTLNNMNEKIFDIKHKDLKFIFHNFSNKKVNFFIN
jgi:hypothetical protein